MPGKETVVITGASAGVGRATARAFGRLGARVGLLARGLAGLEGARREVEALGGQALVLPTDVSDPLQVEAAADAVEREFGPIDIWINNAMVSVFSPVHRMTAADYRRVTDVTYLGTVYGTLAALRRMRPRGRGTIVLVGSVLAYRGIPLQSAYCAAKHAIQGFHDSLRSELLHDNSGVRTTMVHLPAINTPQFDWVKNRMPRRPQPVPPIFQPEVAAESIVWAAHHARREFTVGCQAAVILHGNKVFPGLGDRYLAATGYESQQTDEPADPNRQHNLYTPLPEDHGAHGRFDTRAHPRSVQLWLNTHRGAAAGLLAMAGAAATGLVRWARMRARDLTALLAILWIAGCHGPQSALQPEGPAAASILSLGWMLFVLGAAVVLVVVTTLIMATIRRRDLHGRLPPLPLSPATREQASAVRGPENGAGVVGEPGEVRLDTAAADRRALRWVIGGGVVFPVVTLVPLMVVTLLTLNRLDLGGGEGALTIEVTGRQFWWEVRYLDGDGQATAETANEIHIPTGRPVRLLLRSPDVIHSFWVPRLAGKLDMIPGRMTELRLQADRPGEYRGQCAEYCGMQHAKMAFLVLAEEPAAFESWLAAQAAPAAAPTDSLARAGQTVFTSTACAACHTIRGTTARGELGPDLTHVASRRTLAALALENGRGQLGGWIANPQHLKPGSLMPAVPLGAMEFQALLHYVEGLR